MMNPLNTTATFSGEDGRMKDRTGMTWWIGRRVREVPIVDHGRSRGECGCGVHHEERKPRRARVGSVFDRDGPRVHATDVWVHAGGRTL